MRGVLQAACVVAIALGAGLFAYGSYVEPRNDPSNLAEFSRLFDRPRDDRITSSAWRGFGVGFMTLGVLGLAVPWINVLVFRQRR
jgi:hypothetical protein